MIHWPKILSNKLAFQNMTASACFEEFHSFRLLLFFFFFPSTLFKEVSSIYLRAFSYLDLRAFKCLTDTMHFIYKNIGYSPFCIFFSFFQPSFPLMPTTELFKDFHSINLRAHLPKFHFSNMLITFVEFHRTLNLSPLRILPSFSLHCVCVYVCFTSSEYQMDLLSKLDHSNIFPSFTKYDLL